ncbi:hypothetical protein [Burkholderia gladioli]|uniref:hypothetical protein n=1 Tax=Burkholderia gladioli TaxID=28095 RepID=UPI0015E45B85|nr:hypothetical protein [Burkholderia gladioli]
MNSALAPGATGLAGAVRAASESSWSRAKHSAETLSRAPVQNFMIHLAEKISDVQKVLLDKIIAQHAEVVSAQQVIDAMSA